MLYSTSILCLSLCRHRVVDIRFVHVGTDGYLPGSGLR